MFDDLKKEKENNHSNSEILISGYEKLIQCKNKIFNSYKTKLTDIINDKAEILDKFQIKYMEEHEFLSKKMIELENDNIVLATKLSEYEQQKINEKNQIDISPHGQSEIDNNINTSHKIETSDNKGISLHTRLENLKEKFAIEAIEKNEKIKDVKILEEKFKDLKAKYEQLYMEKEKSESNFFCLKSINKVLDTKLNESKKVNEKIQEKLNSNENECKELKENINKLNSLIIHKDNEISKLNSKNSDLRHEICMAKKDLDKIDEVSLLAKENAEKEVSEKFGKEIHKLKNKNIELENTINNLSSKIQTSNEKNQGYNRNLNELKSQENCIIVDSNPQKNEMESKYLMEIEQLKKENGELYEKIYTNFTFGKMNKYSSESKASQALVDKRKTQVYQNSNTSDQQRCMSNLKSGSMIQDIKMIISKYNEKKSSLLQKD